MGQPDISYDNLQPVQVKFVKTHEKAKLPSKNYHDDNCFDVYAVETVTIPAKGSNMVPVGLTVAYITPGYGFVVRGRSGLGIKHNIIPFTGEIDNAYRNDTAIKLFNLGDADHVVMPGDRIAQFKIERVWNAELSFTDTVEPSHRGGNGIGSSGR